MIILVYRSIKVGDVNGDRIDDLIIGAHKADDNGNSDVGIGYIIYGKSIEFVI